MMTATDLPPVERLYVDTVSVTATSYDWTEGYGESWDYIEAPECPDCGSYAEWRESSCEDWEAWRCPNLAECSTAAAGDELDPHEQGAEGPMMSYFYALPERDKFDQSHAAMIADLPLCLVWWEDRDGYALALTGGGMDLSWEICEAFMRLGYLPPYAYCDLPQMAGMEMDARHRWIVSGCLRTCDVLSTWAERSTERLREMVA